MREVFSAALGSGFTAGKDARRYKRAEGVIRKNRKYARSTIIDSQTGYRFQSHQVRQ